MSFLLVLVLVIAPFGHAGHTIATLRVISLFIHKYHNLRDVIAHWMMYISSKEYVTIRIDNKNTFITLFFVYDYVSLLFNSTLLPFLKKSYGYLNQVSVTLLLIKYNTLLIQVTI